MSDYLKGKVCAVMIVRDEEENIKKCLDSIFELVDQIVIVDTGSKDNTVEICKTYSKVSLVFEEWEGDFSKHRNTAINNTSCEWLFTIDADEVFDCKKSFSFGKLIEMASCENIDVFYIPVVSYAPDGSISRHQSPRIFRNGKAFYKGSVHNQLIFDGKPYYTTEIGIGHFGYSYTGEKAKNKIERTIDLIKKELKENPNNLHQIANLCRSLRNKKDWFSLIRYAETACDIFSDIERKKRTFGDIASFTRAMVDSGVAYMKLGQYENSVNVLLKGFEADPWFLDTLFTLGNSLAKLERYNEAILYYNQFVRCKEIRGGNPSMDFNYNIEDTYGCLGNVYNNIGYCLERVGNLSAAIHAMEKALSVDSKNVVYHELYVKLLLATNNKEKCFLERNTINTSNIIIKKELMEKLNKYLSK